MASAFQNWSAPLGRISCGTPCRQRTEDGAAPTVMHGEVGVSEDGGLVDEVLDVDVAGD